MAEMIPHNFEKEAILGKMAEKQKADKINAIADKALEVFYAKDKGEVATNRKREVLATETVGVLGIGASSVEQLKEVLNDDKKTERQKQNAEEGLDMLAKGTFIAMQYGMNTEMMDLLGKGSAADIDKALPKALNGLGERILKNIISNEEILQVLKELDTKVKEEGWDLIPPSKKEQSETLLQYARRVAKLSPQISVGHKDRDQLEMVSSYMQTKLLDLQEGTNSSGGEKVEQKSGQTDETNKKILEELKRTRALEEKKIEEEKIREKEAIKERQIQTERGRYESFQAMLLHKNTISIDVFQQYAPDWMKLEENKPLMQTLVALANSCFYKWRYGDGNLDVMVDPRGEAVFSAPNEIMQQMYEIPGVRETMESIIQDFFDKGKEEGVFVLKLKEGEDIIKRLQNIGDEQMKLVHELEKHGLSSSDSMMAVSTAYNLLYIGHVFEDADPERRMKPCDAYVEQMRAFIYPAQKARAKQLGEVDSVGTEEGWGGQLGQWLTEAITRAKRKISAGVGNNDPDVKLYSDYKEGKIHPFPERLFASFFVLTEVSVEGGKTMNLGEALFKGLKIDFNAGGRGANPWGSYYDTSDSANRLYKIVKGDQKYAPLPLGDERNIAAVASWAHEVSDARKKVRSKDILKPRVDTREFVKWIIAACTQGGLYQHSAELVLMTPDVFDDQDVSFDGLLKRRDLMETEDDKKWLKKEFHAENFGSRFTRERIVKRLGRKN